MNGLSLSVKLLLSRDQDFFWVFALGAAAAVAVISIADPLRASFAARAATRTKQDRRAANSATRSELRQALRGALSTFPAGKYRKERQSSRLDRLCTSRRRLANNSQEPQRHGM